MIPARLGPYTLLSEIGRGGMGQVVLAVHDTLERQVAIKLLHRARSEDPEFCHRFMREMQIAGSIQHPNLVRIYDGGVTDGIPYLVMELLACQDLDDVAQLMPRLPWPLALAIGSRVADALATLHDLSILHRDVKPSNIVLTPEGVVKLVDFGLAVKADQSRFTADGIVVGTLMYLAPEQLHGSIATPASDMWALGCVLFYLLTGEDHVEDSSTTALMHHILEARTRDPAAISHGLPPAVAGLVMRLLVPAPELRLGSAAQARDEMQDLLARLAATTHEEVLKPGWMEDARQALARDGAPATIFPTRNPDGAGADAAAPPSKKTEVLSRRRRLQEQEAAKPAPTGPAPARAPSVPVRRRLAPRTGAFAVLMVATVLGLGTAGLLRSGWRPASVASGVRASASASPDSGPSRWAPITEPASPVPSQAASVAPSPAFSVAPAPPGDAAPGPIQHYLDWKRHAFRLPRLRAGGRTAASAMAEIRDQTGFDLGPSAEGWTHWLELGAWLENPQASSTPPRAPGAGTRKMNFLEERLEFNRVLKVRMELPASAIEAVHGMVVNWPEDGRPWLLLGRVFEMGGATPLALRAYHMGLARLRAESFEFAPGILWAALARALRVVAGHRPVEEWFARLTDHQNLRRPWNGVEDAFAGTGDPVYRQFLETGRKHPPSRAYATLLLGPVDASEKNQPRAALEMWLEGLRAEPSSMILADAVLRFCLSRGDIAACEPHTSRISSGAGWMTVLRYLREPGAGDLPGADYRRSKVDCQQLTLLEVARLLENGDLQTAETMLKSRSRYDRSLLPDDLAVWQLLAAGVTSEWVFRRCTVDILSPRNPESAWNPVVGILTTPAGIPVMQSLLDQARRRWPDESVHDVAEGLWFARRGLHDQAVEALIRARKRAPAGLAPLASCEILTAPVWAVALGVPADRTVHRDVFEAADEAGKETVANRLCRLVHRGELESAGTLAREQFLDDPSAPLWKLTAYRAAALTDGRPGARDWRRRLRWAARFEATERWVLQNMDEADRLARVK